jgi:hypothetical protein
MSNDRTAKIGKDFNKSILSRVGVAGCVLDAVLGFAAAAYPTEDAVTQRAQQIVRELDSMGVETIRQHGAITRSRTMLTR